MTTSNTGIIAPYRFTAKATSTVAHGEAGANSTGANNTTLFARELTLLQRDQLSYSSDKAQAAIEALMSVMPITESSVEFLRTLSGGELIATLFAAQFPIIYRGEGEGLFTGLERYQYLTTRLTDSAVACTTLATAWAYVSRKLNLTAPAASAHMPLMALFALPKPIQAAALASVLKAPEMVVMGARMLAEGLKATNWKYAEAADRETEEKAQYNVTSTQLLELSANRGSVLAVRIPAISGNSLRHNILRAPGATRLLSHLGLGPNQTTVPIAVERFLYSGGNTVKGAKAPGAADLLEAKVRSHYPIVDALGGSFDMFLLTRSQVSVNSWIVCRENNWITERKTEGSIGSDVSIFDLISEVTRTRSGIGGKDKESGQMIFAYEALAAQTEILVEVSFQPYTQLITIGAVMQALTDWNTEGAFLGAKSAQGHSQWLPDFPDDDRWALAADYIAHLDKNRETLRDGLIKATFGTEVQLCGA